jgi:hypothetical protein
MNCALAQTPAVSRKKWRSSIESSPKCSGTTTSKFPCAPVPKSDWMRQPGPVTLSRSPVMRGPRIQGRRGSLLLRKKWRSSTVPLVCRRGTTASKLPCVPAP